MNEGCSKSFKNCFTAQHVSVHKATSSGSVPPGFTKAAYVKPVSQETPVRFQNTLEEWPARSVSAPVTPTRREPVSSSTSTKVAVPLTPSKLKARFLLSNFVRGGETGESAGTRGAIRVRQDNAAQCASGAALGIAFLAPLGVSLRQWPAYVAGRLQDCICKARRHLLFAAYGAGNALACC